MKKERKVMILAGGKGTRLWPVSRENYPKFFLRIASDMSLLQSAVLRGVRLAGAENVFIVSNAEYRFLLRDHLKEGGIDFPLENIIAEPEGKNTAAAIALGLRALETMPLREGAAQNGSKKLSPGAGLTTTEGKSDPSVFVFPADHLIKDEAKFIAALKEAEKAAGEEYITALGIKPYRAETGYGYIKAAGNAVEKFVEKPSAAKAEKFLKSGNYFWNAGIFVASASVFKEEFSKHAPAIWKAIRKWDGKSATKLEAVYKTLPSISIDYAVMEKTKRAAVVAYDGSWNDLGGWDSVYEVTAKDKKGNAAGPALSPSTSLGVNSVEGPALSSVEGPEVIALDSKNNLVYSVAGKIISLIGVENLRVASTDDALLIMSEGHSQDVKKAVEMLKGNEALVNHIRVRRPWGNFKTLERSGNYKVKVIEILPGRSISLQKHSRRSEEWLVLTGQVEVTLDGEMVTLKEDGRIKIPKGAAHRLTNRGHRKAKILEIARGSYIEEDDIIRLDDDFGRS